jgi:hypothetical protein
VLTVSLDIFRWYHVTVNFIFVRMVDVLQNYFILRLQESDDFIASCWSFEICIKVLMMSAGHVVS